MFDYSHQYSVRVIVNDKTDADEYYHTDGNTYIEARQGSEYSLELQNNTPERVLMIPAIDGLSTIDGQPAGINSPGYVLSAFEKQIVTGWLKDATQVARFVFWDKDNSYANQTGRGTANTGVIGALIFREKPQPIYRSAFTGGETGPTIGAWYSGSLPQNMSVSANCASPVSFQEAGTGHGRLEEFKTSEVGFTKRDPAHPDAQIVLYYDTSKGLERRGIVLRYKKSYAPDPFPNAPTIYRSNR